VKLRRLNVGKGGQAASFADTRAVGVLGAILWRALSLPLPREAAPGDLDTLSSLSLGSHPSERPVHNKCSRLLCK